MSDGNDLSKGTPGSGIEKNVAKAADDARNLGAIADLRIGSNQLFLQTTEQTRMALCISDPHQADCPIVYANQAFVELTGYKREEIIGRNCRFLQGKATSDGAVAKLRAAVESAEYTVVDILNYRKDGTAFWNAVHVGPIYDENGDLAYFFGSQWDITELLAARERIVENERVAAELRHRTDNLFGVLSAIVRLSARGATDAQDLASKIEKRIEALAGAHRVSLSDEGLQQDKTNLRALVEAVLRPYRNTHLDRIDIAGKLIELPRGHVTPIGLTLHELATNALKYGALSENDGKVHVDWTIGRDRVLEIHWREEKGAATPALESQPATLGGGSGTRLIEGVIRGLQGTVETEFAPEGFRATLRIPVPERALA